MKFCHIHVHNEYSQLDGLGTAQQYAEEAKRIGFEYLGLTNHANVDGCIKFQKACNEVGIKPIFGCEFYIVNDIMTKEKGEKRYHICCFVKNQIGWQNIMKMLTIANLDGFYWKPRIGGKILLEYCDGLKITTACSSSFITADWGEEFLQELKHKIGKNNLFLEIMPHMLPEQISTNKLALLLSQKNDLPIVASNDCHYPTPEKALSQEVLLAVQRKAKWTDENRWKFDIDTLYLKAPAEMVKAFKRQQIVDVETVHKAMLNSHLLAKSCSPFQIKKLPVYLPPVKGPEELDETQLLKELCQLGLEKVTDTMPEEQASLYGERVKEELSLICKLGFQRYFLIVWELISWCKKSGIMTGPGRGSVGGCLVAYLLGITKVDPIKYKLLFTRFISPARIDLPDIDMDFEDIKRDRVRRHLEDCYGEDCVAGVSTFLTLKGRAAIRDVSRVFNTPIIDVNAACKSIVVRSGGDFRSDFTIEDAFNTFEDGIKFKKKYPEVSRIAMDIEGQIRGSGMHAAAICVSNKNLKSGEQCNLCRRKKNLTVVNWDKDDAEYMGLMKLDILGLSALTILNQTRKLIKRNHNEDIDFDSLSLNDPKVYEEIGKGNTVGAFQIGSMGLSSYCKELGVENFEALVHATSLWRPGTLRSGLVTEFAERKKGKSYKSIHPIIEELTKDTFGIIIYQEQVMTFMYELAGLPWKTCDTVRKVISKSQGEELFLKFKTMFIKGCEKLGTIDKKIAGKVWEELASFGSYGFNKSHAVEYSMITYWDMWCKIHYPAEFMACSLTYGGEDKKEEYTNEAKRLGIKIMLPTIGKSHATRWKTDSNSKKLYAPFIEIKGIGKKTAEKLTDTEESGFFESPNNKPKKIQLLIWEIHQYNQKEIKTDEDTKKIQSLFQFDISSDPMRSIKGIHDLIKNKVTKIEQINFRKKLDESILLFCKMPEVKFGYRHSILKSSKGKSADTYKIAGIAESLGGVYGFIKDQSKTANAMMVFDSSIYSRKKNEVEHCENKWLLVEGRYSGKSTNNIFCQRMADEEELKKCEFDGIELNLIKKSTKKLLDKDLLSKCDICQLRKEATSPVPPSLGRKNLFILGEAPGREEDLNRKGFIGRAGTEVLWPRLKRYDLLRSEFNISNVVKCFPRITKTLPPKIIRICSEKWLDTELQQSKPVVLLALGNSALYFFKNKESGITQLNGTTEWNSKYNFWICWCIHPASVLYSPENKRYFNIGIRNFYRAINNLL